jgi:serine/threonine protein kinase
MSGPLPPGTLLNDGRYRLTARHRVGGQSVVYEGIDVKFGKQVIVKQAYQDQPGSQRMLWEEARLLSSLNHKAIPRALDCFSENGCTFLVMQRIPGGDIGEILKNHGGAFPHEAVLEWADQLLDILEYLQGQRPVIVHRDITPKNVRLTPDNRIFLLDFGIAKRADYKTYLVGGTPRYAPPEQLKDEGTDTSSDSYSLAATLYYLLTAVEPPDALARESAILKGKPDPLRPACELNTSVPPLLSQVLCRSLSLDRRCRPANAVAIRQRLREACEGTYIDDEETVVSPRHVGASKATRLSGRGPVGGTASYDVVRDNSTENVVRLTYQLERRSVQPGLMLVLIELMDSPLAGRNAILDRYSNLISENQEGSSSTAIRVIRGLAEDAYVEPQAYKSLRATLGRLIANHTLSEISATRPGSDHAGQHDKNLQGVVTFERHINHRKWLRNLAVSAVRGGAAALFVDLLISIFTGGKTAISFLSGGSKEIVFTTHVLLIIFIVLLIHLIGRARHFKPNGCGNNIIYYPLTFTCGFLLAITLFYDLMYLIGMT